MKYNNIFASTILGLAIILTFNFERVLNILEYFKSEVINIFTPDQTINTTSPYDGVLEANKAMNNQDLMGKAWEEFLHENKKSKDIKLIKDSKWGDYMCYPAEIINESQDDKYADMFIAYINRNNVLNKNDWKYEDLSTPVMYSTHPHGRITLREMSPAILGCKKPGMLYRINRYKRKLD